MPPFSSLPDAPPYSPPTQAAVTGAQATAAEFDLQRRLAVVTAGVVALLVAAMAACIMLICGGHLIYSLDDPYISLSLASHIAQGHYGVNAGEAASPSSSIFYPLILAVFSWAQWQQYVPAIINGLAASVTAALFGLAFCRWGIVTRQAQLVLGIVLVTMLCLALNTIGVVFTGLEHSLHALTSAFTIFWLARALEENKVPAALVVAIVLLPLWRFEGIALAGLVIAALAVTGYWRAAAVAGFGIAVTLGAYAMAMHGLGLPLLPSSVLRKSDIAARVVDHVAGHFALVGAVVRNAIANLNAEAVPILLLLVLVVAHPLLRALRSSRSFGSYRLSLRRELLFAAVVAGALLAQIVFGSWGGGFARYEAYTAALGAAGVMVLWGGTIGNLLARGSPVTTVAAVLSLFVIGQISIVATAMTPFSARGIYEMHYEMRRLSVDFYRHPVAVIDLGLVSYRNPNYVLDLWGLGSEAVRKARANGEVGTAWLDRIVQARQVGMAMVYDNWFADQVPPDWRRIAVLQADHRPSGYDKITFYATSASDVADAEAALHDFSQGIGQGIHVTFEKIP